MKKLLTNSAISTLGFLLAIAFSPLANAAENPFGMSKTVNDMHVASNNGEGKCGDSMKKSKCGDSMKESKCGDSMKKTMKDGKCGDSMKKAMKDGKCGEGKCGDSMKKAMKDDSKCGGN